MPTDEYRPTGPIGVLPAHGPNLERSAIEQQERALQADSAAHAEILRRTGGRDAGDAILPAGVIATRAKNLFGQLRARAIGASVSPVLSEPVFHPDDPSLTQVGLMPRHKRRASDTRQKAETEAALASPPVTEMPGAETELAEADEPQPRARWSLSEIVPSIDFETSDLRRRIEGAQHGAPPQSAGRRPGLLIWPLLAGICLGLGDLVLRW